jgi:tRNA modification GTPase
MWPRIDSLTSRVDSKNMIEDTIAAISTPIGEGAIAIVRVSGLLAFEVADRIFVSQHGKPSSLPSHTIHFGTIGTNGDLIDEVMLSVMRAPRTYTGEHTVEINCHGGIYIAQQILSRCLNHGARLAEPGEFTKRAFLNGRIDLTQAEAVMDLISARTGRAQTAAVHALQGHVSRRIDEARERLLTILAHLEAHIDFPDEEIQADTREELIVDLVALCDGLQALRATADEGRLLRQGILVAIIGRPNAGKSSLMNALLGEDRAIVSAIPGTTRDTIEETANMRGIPVRLTDTAGIRRARGRLESAGVLRSHNVLDRSDLVIHILDGARKFHVDDLCLAGSYGSKKSIQVINKSDLRHKLKLPAVFPQSVVVHVSALTGNGLEQLKDSIESIALSGAGGSLQADVVINERHSDALRRVIDALKLATHEFRNGVSHEIVAQQLRIGLNALGEIVGKTATEDILDKIFSTFCIGK